MEEDCGRRPGKSGTRTVTSVSSTKRLGSGVVVDGVVVVVVVVAAVVVLVVVVAFCSDAAVVDVALAKPTVSTDSVVVDDVIAVVVDVAGADAFCKPKVFQMDGPTELNQGGLGLAVDDVGMATKKNDDNKLIMTRVDRQLVKVVVVIGRRIA